MWWIRSSTAENNQCHYTPVISSPSSPLLSAPLLSPPLFSPFLSSALYLCSHPARTCSSPPPLCQPSHPVESIPKCRRTDTQLRTPVTIKLLHWIVLHCFALHCIVLHSIALYYMKKILRNERLYSLNNAIHRLKKNFSMFNLLHTLDWTNSSTASEHIMEWDMRGRGSIFSPRCPQQPEHTARRHRSIAGHL